ncbi:LolA family protein [Litorihabitans aurantiacus]|nr:hypothetical protein [Litorihabitans aurantiacus]
MKSNRLRWAVPAATAVAVGAAFTIPSLATASADELPETTPAQLLAAVAQAEPTAMSGTAVYTARLGLPELPAEMTGGADPLNLLSGSSTIRVWTDGAERSRVSLLGTASEYSAVVDGAEAWTYSSGKNEVVHVSLDAEAQSQLDAAKADAQERADAVDPASIPTPEVLAEQFLALAGTTSEVTLEDDVVVAGRDAYQLEIAPRGEGSLVDRVVVAFDGETYAPLSVQAWSTQDTSAPALELAFTDVSMETPSDAALAFSTPEGATVEEKVITGEDLAAAAPQDEAAADALDPEALDPSALAPGAGFLPEGTSISGFGWSTVVQQQGVDVAGLLAGDPEAAADAAAQLPASPFAGRPAEDLAAEFGADRADGGFGLDASALYEQLTAPVDGGRVFSSALLSALVTDDGRVLVGAVPTDTLLATAGLS